MRTKNKLPIWLTGIAMGVTVAALPSAPAFAKEKSELQKVEGKDVPEVIRKEFRSQVKGADDLNFFRWPQADGRVLYVVKGGAEGAKKMMIFSQDGTVVEGVTAARPNDKLVAPGTGATASSSGTGTVSGEMSSLQQQVSTYRTLVESERTESEREAQRAKDIAARQESGTLKGTDLDEQERQGAVREQQALARYQEAVRQSDDFRAKAAAATNAQVREQYSQLQQLAETRARVNSDTARYATATQRALDQAEIAAASGAAVDPTTGTTRKRVDINDLPPRVRETFGKQTDGATNSTYYATTAGGRTTYTANYTRSGEQWFVRSNADGQITRGPVPINDETRLASGREPGSSGAGSASDLNDDEAGKGSGLSMSSLPSAVRKTFQSKMDARAEKFATFVKHEKNGKATYHAIWHPNGDNSKNAHLFVDESGKVTREFVKDNPNAK